MQRRIELSGMTAEEFARVFQPSGQPEVGNAVPLQDGVTMTNLTSPGPNLVDGGLFVVLVESTVEIASTVLIGLLTNYLYDILKGRRLKAMEQATKIKITVQDEGDDEQA